MHFFINFSHLLSTNRVWLGALTIIVLSNLALDLGFRCWFEVYLADEDGHTRLTILPEDLSLKQLTSFFIFNFLTGVLDGIYDNVDLTALCDLDIEEALFFVK